jgi:hypothetical protein
MTVSVIIPWRRGCPHREAALSWTLDQWRAAGREPVLGHAPDGPWCKAEAVAEALPRATGEVLVIADADVWCDGIEAAVTAVQGGAPWAIPHGKVHRLAERATSDLLAGGPLRADLAQPAYRGFEGGGITVLGRALYDQAPLDARFISWGQEDEAWALALRALAGAPWRGDAPLYHLWHPPQKRLSRRWGSRDSQALYRQYRRAAGRPDRMRALLADVQLERRGSV